jgi:ubiquinone/menaquinone biosynthesis C-methylase UbiE
MMIKENIDAVSYYNIISKSYDILYREEQEKKLFLAKGLLNISKDDIIIDIGCGSGFSSEFPCKVYGIDPSTELIKLAIKKNIPNTFFQVAHAEKIPFPDNHFTKAISLTAIQNFNSIPDSIKEIFRVLKNSSISVLSILNQSPKLNSAKNEIKHHFKILKEINEGKDIFFLIQKV